MAQTMKVKRSRSFLSSSLMLWPAPHRTACNASPSAPFNGLRASRPSVFICPIVGSIALRRLIIACSVRLMPRFCPDRRIRMPSSSAPWYPRSTITIFGVRSARMLTCSIASSSEECSGYGFSEQTAGCRTRGLSPTRRHRGLCSFPSACR